MANYFEVSFEYLLNDELDEDKAVFSDKPKKRKIVLKVVIAIMIIYLITVIPKLILFLYIVSKNDINNIKSYNYTYNIDISMIDTETNETVYFGGSRIVFFKDNVERIVGSFGRYDLYSSDYESWMFIDTKEYYEKNLVNNFRTCKEKQKYTYHEGVIVNKEYTPFEIVSNYKYKFGVWQILNPLKYYDIIDDGKMIVPLEEDSELYINIRSGYLEKIIQKSKYSTEEKVYMGIEVDNTDNEQIELKEDTKDEIKEESKKQEDLDEDFLFLKEKI